MSAKHIALDRNARRALIMVGVMLVLVLALALWSFSSRLKENNALTNSVPKDDRLVVIGKQTAVVEPGAFGQILAAWLRSSEQKTLSFELSDRSFQGNSATPTNLALMRLGQVAAVAKTRPNVTIHILEPIDVASTANKQLDEQRAERLRQELVARGVSASHVTIESEQNDLPFAKSPYLSVLLTK